MRKCVNCKTDIVGDGRYYPGSPEDDQPEGIVCRPCEQDLLNAQRNRLRREYQESLGKENVG